jgi:hypothetical protein
MRPAASQIGKHRRHYGSQSKVSACTTYSLQQNIPNSGYYVANASATHDLVLRRSSGQTNPDFAELAGDLIYDFRPEFIFLVGTEGDTTGEMVCAW